MKNYANRLRLIPGCNPQLPEAVQAFSANVHRRDRPALRLRDLLKLVSLGRSRTFELHWTPEVIAWIGRRANKFCGQREGN